MQTKKRKRILMHLCTFNLELKNRFDVLKVDEDICTKEINEASQKNHGQVLILSIMLVMHFGLSDFQL